MSSEFLPNSGFQHGAVSGKQAAFNLFDRTASFSSINPFTLNDMFITKGLGPGFTLIRGYVGTTLTYSQEIFSSSNKIPTLVTLNWSGLSSVTISTFNAGEARYSVVDNIRVNEAVAPVPEPEPETYALMGMGLVGLLAARRRKMK